MEIFFKNSGIFLLFLFGGFSTPNPNEFYPFTFSFAESFYYYPDLKEQEGDYLYYSTSDCLGNCPVFFLSVLPNGRVYFKGRRGAVKFRGKEKSWVAKDTIYEVDKILKILKQIPQDCEYEATDSPSVFIEWRIGGKTKTFDHYYGCFDFPRKEEFYKEMEKIDSLLEIKKWIKN